MRKVIAAILLLCGLTARAQFTAQWFFQNFTQNPQAIFQVNTTPLWIITQFGTNLIAGQRQAHQTDGGGVLTVSNMVPGAYRVDFIGGVTFTGFVTNSFTNVFPAGTTGTVNAANFLGANTDHFLPFDSRYLAKVLPSIPGYVPTAIDTNGDYTWQPGGGGGSGYQVQAGNALIQITTNGVLFIYTLFGVDQTNFLGTNITLAAFHRTNEFDLAGAALASTNGYPWSALYDVAGSALASTQAMSLASGLAAFRPTNSFASSNVMTLSANGIGRPDGVTLTVAPDGTLSAPSGGSGNVSGPPSSTDATFAIYLGASGKIITNRTAAGTFGPASFDASGSAFAATNGWPWGVLYDPIGTAASVQSTVQSWLVLSNAQYQAQFANSVTNHDTRNLVFTGTHTNSGGVILPNAMAVDTNSAVSNTNMTAWVYTNTLDVRPLASPTTTNLIGIGSQSNALVIIPGTGLQLATNGNGTSTLNVTVTGGSSVFAITNIYITNSTAVLLDFSSFNVFKLWVETNVAWITTNSTSLTQKAYIYYHNDTNGGWALNSFANAGGIVVTNANMQFTTNASALDILEILPGFWNTNIAVYWPQNFQPRQAFTNSLSGGGGGGGGTITEIFATGAGGTSGGCTTAATNTAGCTLFIAAAAGYRSPYPTNSSSPANPWTTNNTVADAGSGAIVRLSLSSSPTTGASQTFSASGGDVGTAFSHVGIIGVSGATALDGEASVTNTSNTSTSVQVGSSLTPSQSGEIFVVALRANVATTWSIDSGFTIDFQGTNVNAETLVFAHKIKTDALAERPTFTKLTGSLADCSVVMADYK